jgi:hypothetical protein
MASKSKDVRMEQLRIFEKKLALRLQTLEQKGIGKEKAQSDPLVKKLKSKIRQTHVRITVFDKFVQRTQELAQTKAQKLAEPAAKEEKKSTPTPAKETSSEDKQVEPKPKKKVETSDKETKKQPAVKEEAAPKEPKEPKKQPTVTDEATAKKAKKPPAADGEAAPKKKASKKKEE